MKKLVVFLCIALAAPAWAQSPAKFALVIGNAAYTARPWNSLVNPVNDAGDMAAALRGLGFEVDLIQNGNLARMENAVITLKRKLRSSARAYGFFYYAGHGAQNERDGGNYLIPVDAETPSLNLLPQRALPVEFVLDELEEAGNMLNMVVLDACRNVPNLTRGAPRGLSVLGNIPRGSIVMYATAANKTASDGEGTNGLFTSHLLRNLTTPGLDVSEIFRRTGSDVAKATGGDQFPEMRVMFFETAYLGAPPVDGVGAGAGVSSTRELPEMKHSNAVISAAFSPDGKYIASGSADRTVRVWDATSRREIRMFAGHSEHVVTVAWSPDGKYLASGSADGTVRIWDMGTRSEIRSLTGHSAIVMSVAFSPDGKYLVSSSDDSTIKLWDVATGREIRSLAGHSDAVWPVVFSPDGKYIASGSVDKTIKLWDVATGREIRTLAGHSDRVRSVAFSPDGRFIASGSWDNTIKLWDAVTGREIRTLAGHSGTVSSLAFSPDGRFIVSGSYDNTIKLWDAVTGREIRTFAGDFGIVQSVAFSPDGRYIVSGSNETVRIWDTATGEQK